MFAPAVRYIYPAYMKHIAAIGIAIVKIRKSIILSAAKTRYEKSQSGWRVSSALYPPHGTSLEGSSCAKVVVPNEKEKVRTKEKANKYLAKMFVNIVFLTEYINIYYFNNLPIASLAFPTDSPTDIKPAIVSETIDENMVFVASASGSYQDRAKSADW